MPEVRLQGPRIDALVRQREATGMPQLMRMDLEIEACGPASSRYELLEACDCKGCPTLAEENKRAL